MQKKRLSLSPLQLMQKFYNDYSRQKQYSTNNDEVTCKYSRHVSSDTDKLTRFLNTHNKRQRGNSTAVSSDSNNFAKKNHTNESPSRYRMNQSQKVKRSYFKNSYTQSHPFLVTQHKIKQKQLDEIKLKTEPIEFTSKALYQNFKLMTPVQNRSSVEEIKQKMIRIKVYKKQRMEKIRYNYLVNNCFKANNRGSQLDLGCSKGSRIKLNQINTKERIFPTCFDQVKKNKI